MIRSVVRSAVVAALLLVGASVCARAATLDAIEYYNAPLDHYFITALPDEIAKLDAGMFANWTRTGQHFAVFDPASPVAGASAVCRFYGSPAAGLDSHFYSASVAECAAVRQRFAGIWREETDNAFGVWLPDPVTGACPASSVPVYRAWNNRVDSNHRFTTDPATLQAMVAKGYIAEGYGPAPTPVAMCAPVGGSAGTVGTSPPPKCALVHTTQTEPPTINGFAVMEVTCDSAVGNYSWSGCVSTSSVCTVREDAPGNHSYSVIARGAGGSSAPVTLTLDWVASAPAPPGLCSQFPSYLVSDIGTESARVESVFMPVPPGFAWNGAWAVRFVVPATMNPALPGRLSAAEFAGQPTVREATISHVPCDFRATDPTGANGPYARGSGISTTNWFTIDPTRSDYPLLSPGGTYYYNVRNFQPSDDTISWSASAERCDAYVDSLLPR